MNTDVFFNFIIGICIVAGVGSTWSIAKEDVANDCRSMGMTKISDTVFECKEKNNG